MQGPALVAGFHQARHAALVIARARLQLGFAQNAAHGLARNAVVDHVHHAAHGAATVLQGGRAAQHFDALGRQHVQWHRVVVAQRRGV